MNKGQVKQVLGPVVDVEFVDSTVPEIYNALEIELNKETLTLEVQNHLGEGLVRTVALGSTDGLKRGVEVLDTGKPITVPVGEEVLGRILNVVGAPIDKKGEVKAKKAIPFIDLLQILLNKKPSRRFLKPESKLST